jgi:nucleolar protein 14
VRINKQKYEILNKVQKGQTGKPLAINKRGQEVRKAALKLSKQNRGNLVVDKRIGEFNLSKEEQQLKRVQKLKSQKIKFNLQDEDEYELTHLGQSLDQANDSLPESDGEDINEEMVKETHFGGFGEKKTRNEIMKEIIQKSKSYKRERQMVKEQDMDIQEALDKDLDEIKALLAPISQGKMLISNDRLLMLQGTEQERVKEQGKIDQDKEYDQFVRELQYDKRAKPTDRIKSDQELAKDDLVKLQKLEQERIDRMNGVQNETEPKKKRGAVADDLDESYLKEDVLEIAPLTYKDGVLVNDEIFMKHHGHSNESGSEVGSESESESDSESELESGSESELEVGSESELEAGNKLELEAGNELDAESADGSDEEQSNSDVEFEEEEASLALLKRMNESGSDSDEKPKTKRQKVSQEMQKARQELPFHFEAPQTSEDFAVLTENRNSEEIETIIKRLRVIYNVKLGSENRPKMLKLMKILLKRIIDVGETEDIDYSQLQAIDGHFVALARQFPIMFSKWCHSRIVYLRDRLNKHKTFPQAGDLFIMKGVARYYIYN